MTTIVIEFTITGSFLLHCVIILYFLAHDHISDNMKLIGSNVDKFYFQKTIYGSVEEMTMG